MAKSRSRRSRKRKAAPSRRRSRKRPVKRARKPARRRKVTKRRRSPHSKARGARRPTRRAKRARPAQKKRKRVTKTRGRARKVARARTARTPRQRKAPALDRERRSLKIEELTAPVTTRSSPPPTEPAPVTGGDADAQWTSLFSGSDASEHESPKEADVGEMLDFEGSEPEPPRRLKMKGGWGEQASRASTFPARPTPPAAPTRLGRAVCPSRLPSPDERPPQPARLSYR